MKKISIVTGGGTGIGRAIALRLANLGHEVLIIGRRVEVLEETRKLNSSRITCLQADVSKVKGRQEIFSFVENRNIEFLVHNAAILGEITKLEKLTLEEWHTIMAINVEGPMFLTQLLLPLMHKSRILHISSGAAHHAIKGWTGYCVSKAALYMLYLMQNAEYKEQGVLTASLKPGIVDTEMQELIRQADVNEHPNMQKFHDLYNDDELESCDRVAKMVAWILTKTRDKEYIENEFDIRDEKIQERWDK